MNEINFIEPVIIRADYEAGHIFQSNKGTYFLLVQLHEGTYVAINLVTGLPYTAAKRIVNEAVDGLKRVATQAKLHIEPTKNS